MMKKLITITVTALLIGGGATEMWARGQLDCQTVNWSVQSFLDDLEDKSWMSLDEAAQWKLTPHPDDLAADPDMYVEREVSDGSWKQIMVDIWEEREPDYRCQQDVICKYKHRKMLGDRIEKNCARGDYRPNTLQIAIYEAKEAYRRIVEG